MRNWKTTLSGLVTALATLAVYESNNGVNLPRWAINLAVFISIGGLAGMGIAAKDRDVTGGTRIQSVVSPATEIAVEKENEKKD